MASSVPVTSREIARILELSRLGLEDVVDDRDTSAATKALLQKKLSPTIDGTKENEIVNMFDAWRTSTSRLVVHNLYNKHFELAVLYFMLPVRVRVYDTGNNILNTGLVRLLYYAYHHRNRDFGSDTSAKAIIINIFVV